MKTFLSFLLLACCALQCSASCVTCEYGVQAVDGSGALVERLRDTQTEVQTQLTSLLAASFTAINATIACTTNNVCGSNSTCTAVTTEIFQCVCDASFELVSDGATISCDDIDECTSTNYTNNCSSDATCTNVSPWFTCACNPGYTGDGVTCTDITECTPNPCADNATCAEPAINNYTCTCISGYDGNPYTNCTDIDECASNLDDCHVNATCTNTDPGFNCTCITGFTGNGTYCEDIDECTPFPCGANSQCSQPVLNNYTCTCDPGYNGDPYANCTDIQECLSSPCLANATCNETAGSFTCTCPPGFSGDGVTTCDPALLELEFYITCASLLFNSSFTDQTSTPYTTTASSLSLAIDAWVSSIDWTSSVANVTYNFTNSSDGYGYAQAFVLVEVNNTHMSARDFLTQLNISESICSPVSSANECLYGTHNCSSGTTCVDSEYGFCCNRDHTYTAGVTLNVAYNASVHGDMNSNVSQTICAEIQTIIENQLNAKQFRGCNQNIVANCDSLRLGLEAVFMLQITDATYDLSDITTALNGSLGLSTTYGNVIAGGDFDECAKSYTPGRNCSVNGTCLNSPVGSFTCQCNSTYYDNGTNPGEICVEPVTIACGQSNITVTVLENYFTEHGISLSMFHLADESCNRTTHSTTTSNVTVFTFSMSDCNTAVNTSSDNSTIYISNQLSNTPSTGFFTGLSLTIPLQCEIPSAANFSSPLNGQLSTFAVPDVVSTGAFNLAFNTLDSTFTTPTAPGKTFLSNEIIYIEVSITNAVSGVSVKIDRCWGTPTANSADPTFIEFLTNGCPTAGTPVQNVRVVRNGQNSARVEFQSFFFTSVNQVYVHCEAQACSPSCLKTCSKKRKREAEVEEVITTEEVEITIVLKLDPSDVQYSVGLNGTGIGRPGENHSLTSEIAIPVVTAVLAFVLIILPAVLVVVVVRRRRQHSGSKDFIEMKNHDIAMTIPNC